MVGRVDKMEKKKIRNGSGVFCHQVLLYGLVNVEDELFGVSQPLYYAMETYTHTVDGRKIGKKNRTPFMNDL